MDPTHTTGLEPLRLRPFPLLLRVAVVWLLLLPSLASAQVLRGRVVDPSDGGAVEGAMVVLLDEEGRRRAAMLTSATGLFRLEAPGAGRYRLRADRIGYRSAYSSGFDLARVDTAHVIIQAEVDAIPLEGIEVDGRGRCSVRPTDGLSTARVWEEIRKALAAAEWTDEMGMYRYRLVHHSRVVDRRGREVESADSTLSESLLRSPFHAQPAPDLISRGFVRREGEEHVFYGPDAAVLLSDDFLDTHCLRLRQGADETAGLLGLEFEPVEARGVAEIRGTLWLDPDVSELRRLDYEYVNLDEVGLRGEGGGRITFQRLPNGAWIVRDWEIRMPLLDRVRPYRVAGYRTGGGTVVQIQDQAGRTILEESSGTLTGVVVDSTGAEPVKGAVVRVAGLEGRIPTDEDGVFYLSGLEDGVYELSASTPLLLAGGVDGEAVRVEVRRGDIATVRLRIPSAVVAALRQCAGELGPGREGIVLGTVLDRSWDAYLAGAEVRARWAGSAADESAPGSVARTGMNGQYVICGVPLGRAIELEVSLGDATMSNEIVLSTDAPVLVRDFRLDMRSLSSRDAVPPS